MEMPDGWKNQFDRFNDSLYLNLSMQAQLEYGKALFLMKEMAESLEAIKYSLEKEQDYPAEIVLANIEGHLEVLNKFKEWK